MSINRAPFNALTDDDGSNTVGSIWNKNAIKNVLLDPIDAALTDPSLTLKNPAAPVDHRMWQLSVVGNGLLYFLARNDAGNVDEVAYPAVLDRTGNLYIYGNLVEKNRPTPMGHWQTGDVSSYLPAIGLSGPIRWSLVGKTLTVLFNASGVLPSGLASIPLTIPGGFTSALVMVGAGLMCNTPTKAWHTGVITTSGGFTIDLYDELLTGWSAGQHYINGTIIIPIP
jgi:hypothetical protein